MQLVETRVIEIDAECSTSRIVSHPADRPAAPYVQLNGRTRHLRRVCERWQTNAQDSARPFRFAARWRCGTHASVPETENEPKQEGRNHAHGSRNNHADE